MNFKHVFFIAIAFLIFTACNDDEEIVNQQGVVNFTESQLVEVENATQSLSINIGVDQSNHGGGTVDVSIAGGEYGTDYTTSEDASDFTVTIEPIGLIGSFTILPIDNEDIEGNKNLVITLSNPTGDLILGEDISLDFTILDNDNPMVALVSFEEESSTINENDTNPSTISLELNQATTLGGTVTIEASGTAVYGVDYTVSGATDATFVLDVAAGATNASFDIVPIDNDEFEADKEIVFTLTDATDGLSLGVITEHTTTIVNDDISDEPLVDFDASNPTSVIEDAGNVILNFEVSLPTSAETTVTVTATGTATIGDDYTLEGGTANTFDVIIPAGATTGTLTLQIIDDADAESSETIVVDISNVTGGANAGTTTQQNTVSIVDNDSNNTPIDYLETFEGFDGTDGYLTDVLLYQRDLVTQTIDPTKLIDLIENAGSFTDPDDITMTSDKGLNLFYNTGNDPANNGILDNVIITSPLDGTGPTDINLDVAYAFKNQNTAEVTFYWSDTYNGSGDFNEADWTVMGTETVAAMDGEGFGNNDYKREAFVIEPTSTFYIAIRVNQTLDDDNYRLRWRFDNLRAVTQ